MTLKHDIFVKLIPIF